MNKKFLIVSFLLVFLISCTPEPQVTYDPLMGFSASPPQLNPQSYVDNIKDFMQVSSMVLFHEEAVWDDAAIDKKITDYKNFKKLIGNKQMFIMVGPLHATDRRKISNAIPGKSFADEDVRSSYKKLILGISEEVKPEYLGIGAEVNGYAKATDDFDNYVTLYNELYDEIKAISPNTKVFVSFQYEDFLGLWDFNPEDEHPPQWDLIDKFKLDLFAISTYPYLVHETIPADYYAQIRQHTSLPVAVAEAGYPSKGYESSEEKQADFLREVNKQLDVEFFVYFQHRDFDAVELKSRATQLGLDANAVDAFGAIGLKNFDGSEKKAYDVWRVLFEESKP